LICCAPLVLRALAAMPPKAAGPRTKVFPHRVSGCISEWKGKFGWIEPDQPINHPEARKKGGRIYLGVEDVEDEIEGIGSQVSFFVYADGSGLGAMNCRPGGAAGGQALRPAPARAAPARPAQPQMSRPAPGGGAPPKGKGKGKGKGKEPREHKPEPKTRVSDDEYVGKIKVFKKHHGWIEPNDPIEHEAYRGKVYFSISDCEPKELIATGAEVSFVLYTDSQGLGAESITVLAEAPEGAEEVIEEVVEKPPLKKKPAPPVSKPPAAAAAPQGQKRGLTPSAGGKPAGKRQRVTELEVTGEVLEWKGTHGFISSYDSIDHPAAKKNDGRIKVTASNITGEDKTLNEGQLVQFHVFVDQTGLNAEEVQPF